jgi:hypothetical protein
MDAEAEVERDADCISVGYMVEGGDVLVNGGPPLKTTCSIDGCERPTKSRGWCRMHYSRWQRTGDPAHERPTELERFLALTEKTETCWNWTGFRDAGYGRFHVADEQRAHRWSYKHFVGPIPKGLVLDHVCRNRGCVNPEHLRVVTTKENTFAPGSRAPAKANAQKTHCPKGHEYTPENIGSNGLGGRACLACRKLRAAR